MARIMLNVVSERAGIAAAILIRALETLEGIELMQPPPQDRPAARFHAPARDALLPHSKSGAAHDGLDLCAQGSLWLGESSHPVGPIGKTVRIGITQAAESTPTLLRSGNPSGQRPGSAFLLLARFARNRLRAKIIELRVALLLYPKFL